MSKKVHKFVFLNIKIEETVPYSLFTLFYIKSNNNFSISYLLIFSSIVSFRLPSDFHKNVILQLKTRTIDFDFLETVLSVNIEMNSVS